MLSKTIYQYNKNNRLVRIWANSRAADKNGFDRRHIIKCCKGRRNTHKGFKWSYIEIIDIVVKEVIDIGSDFSGVGAFEQALIRLRVPYNNIFACDNDKYVRKTYLSNYEPPIDFPEDVYDRKIPTKSLGIYMTSPPCQGFSLAGKRGGSILFYNSLEFIRKNNPRYFIFENVKGLLSHDKTNKKSKYGKTFETWIKLLGGKSVNNIPTFFGTDDSINYHIHYRVLNAKHYGVPQNRERIFIIGIRDDSDNNFTWPLKVPLLKRLKDVLEENVDEKYYLSENNIKALIVYNKRQVDNDRGFSAKFRDVDTVKTMDALKVGGGGKDDLVKIGAIRGRNPENPTSRESGLPTQQMLEINQNGTSNALTTVQKDNVVVEPYKIRRLTPRECFRLQDFPYSFKWDVSDTQAYKQAGNSIPVKFLELIIKNLLNL